MGESVLVPIDGSPLSYRALEHAIEKFPDAEIVVYHVANIYEPGYELDDASLQELLANAPEWEAIERAAADHLFAEAQDIAAASGRQIVTDTAVGDPQRLIPEYARNNDVDQIVMGVHGREANRSIVGRVAETVVFRAPVSVTVIR